MKAGESSNPVSVPAPESPQDKAQQARQITSCLRTVIAGARDISGGLATLRLAGLLADVGKVRPRDGAGWLGMIADATPASSDENGNLNVEGEAERLSCLGRATGLLLARGADPMLYLDTLLKRGHREWVIEQLIVPILRAERENRPLRTPDGQHLLHRVSAQTYWLFSGGTQHPWIIQEAWPESWLREGRPQDGATPLHLVWSLTEGAAARVLEAASHNQRQEWMAYEHMEQAIFMSQYLVDRGASWEDEDQEGISAGERMLLAFEAGVGEWIPNVGGVEWIHEPLREQRQRRDASVCRSQLEFQTAPVCGERRSERL